MKRFQYVLMLLLCGMGFSLFAQSPAALQKLTAKYDASQLEDIKTNTHYKYEGLLLFYAESFLVEDADHQRPATEAEIAAINLDAHNALRQVETNVTVVDVGTGLTLVLLSRNSFEQLYKSRLSDADLTAYERYKANALDLQKKTQY